jgi:hypothetical protein
MTPAQLDLLIQAHNKFNDPDASKNGGSQGLRGLAQAMGGK